MSALPGPLVGEFLKAVLDAGHFALSGDLRNPELRVAIEVLHTSLLEVIVCDGHMELCFGDDHVLLNGRKVRLAGAAGGRLAPLLDHAASCGWLGISCEEIPSEDQLITALARFAERKLKSSTPGLQRRLGPIRWLEAETDEEFSDESLPALQPIEAGAEEASMLRQVQVSELEQLLGSSGSEGLEKVTKNYARSVYFVSRFLESMEISGPRIPLDEASRIVCDLVDCWTTNPKELLAMALAHPRIGAYDAFHQANTALLGIAIAGSLGMTRDALFEIALTGLLHQVGIVDMPERIRSHRILEKDERKVLATLRLHSVRRLLQVHGPDLAGMARLNAIMAMKDPVAVRRKAADGTIVWVAAKPQPPVAARVLQVAAYYDALTSEREFRQAMSAEQALRLMSTRMRAILDQAIVRLLARLQNLETVLGASAGS